MDLDYLHHVRDESDRFLAVLDDVEPTADVPACPGWTTVDLLWHLGEVQYFWSRIVRERLTDPDDLAEPDRPEGYSALADFFRSTTGELLEVLAATPPDTAVWTWFDADQTAGFVRRRMAHEALIHRVDAELTAGATPAIDTALASGGVWEVLDCMFAGPPRWAASHTRGATGRVTVTDSGATRLVRLDRWSGTSPDTGTTYTDAESITVVDGGEATFEVSGAARDLDLWMWNRPIPGEITLTGDTTAFERVIAEGVQ